MLIQRRPPCSTTSTRGSWGACWSALPSARARAERRSLGLGRLGIASKRVVQRGHIDDSTRDLRYPPPFRHSRCIKRGGGTWPYETPATTSRPRPRGKVPIPLRCDWTPSEGPPSHQRRRLKRL